MRLVRAGLRGQVESWAFALDAPALDLLTAAGVFNLRTCKLCDDGIVARAQRLGHVFLSVSALQPTSRAAHRCHAPRAPRLPVAFAPRMRSALG